MFKIIKLFVLAVSIFASSVFAGETTEISQQELLGALKTPNNNIVLLDVRSHEEYSEGHVAGAINISHNTVEDNLNKLSQYKENTIVIYCRSGRRAGVAANILEANGFTNLRHLTGDMNGWLEAELPVVSNDHKH